MVKIKHNGDDDDDGGGDIEDHVGQVLVKLRAEAGAFLVRVSNCLSGLGNLRVTLVMLVVLVLILVWLWSLFQLYGLFIFVISQF